MNKSQEITIITPTSDRLASFAICERWMSRTIAEFDGVVHWIVADDGTHPVECTMGQRHLRLPHSDSRLDSFVDNLIAALRCVATDKVLFVEDDDWYSSEYIVKMSSWLDDASIVGQARAKYYNITNRRYRVCNNYSHASLCQTGIRGPLVPWMLDFLEYERDISVDVLLWSCTPQLKIVRSLDPETTLVVGMKGLPGTRGLGIGHRLPMHCPRDDDGSVLCRWMPPADASIYLGTLGDRLPESGRR